MKKRTRVPFYGKRHQRAVALAASLANRGELSQALAIRKRVSDDLKKRRGHAS